MKTITHRYHDILSEYFHRKNYFLESLEDQRKRAKQLPPSPRPVNTRKVVELPWQRIQSSNWDEVENLFTDLHFFEAKAEGGKVFDLVKELSSAVKIIPSDRPKRHILSLLEEALRRDVHFISRHPTTLFQCMWNTCWWYDCPLAAIHYAANYGPWKINKYKLCELLEDWRILKENELPGFLWLRSLRPLPQHLGTGQSELLNGHEGGVSSIAISNKGDWIASGSWDCTIRIWAIDSGMEIKLFHGHERRINSIAITSDDSRIVSGSSDGTIRIWDLETSEALMVIDTNYPNYQSIESIALSKDDRWIVSGSDRWDNNVNIWDFKTGQKLMSFSGHKRPITCVAISPDDLRIVSSSWDETVRVWETQTGKELMLMQGHNYPVHCVAISTDCKWLVSGSSSIKGFSDEDISSINADTIRLWNMERGEEVNILSGHGAGVMSVAISLDSKFIVSGSRDNTIRIWKLETGEEVKMFKGHIGTITSIRFGHDGQTIISGSLDRTVRIWNMEASITSMPLRGHKCTIDSVSISKDSRYIITSSSGGSGILDKTLDKTKDESIHIWDLETGEDLRVLESHKIGVERMAISNDSQRIVSSSWDLIRIWDITTGEELNRLKGHDLPKYDFIISNDSRWIVGSCRDNSVRVWDIETGEEQQVLKGFNDGVTDLAISSNSRLIVACSRDKTIRIWDIISGKEIIVLEGHEDEVWCIAISNCGSLIISASLDKTIRIWDIATGEVKYVLSDHDSIVTEIAISKDNNRIVASIEHNRVCIWNLNTIVNPVQPVHRLFIEDPVCDLNEIADLPKKHLRAIPRLGNIYIENQFCELLALLPDQIWPIKTLPFGKGWAGGNRNYLYIIRLEGNVE